MVDGRTSSWPYRLGIVIAALLSMCGGHSLAATTTYTGVWAGGTIAPNDTVVLDNGASVTGNVVANGTLQFNQSAPSVLTISRTITGMGALSLTNTGTLQLTGTSVAVNTVVLNLTTTASAGLLQVRSGTGVLRVGSSGTGTLNVTGGRITNSEGYLGYTAGSVGTASVSSGTWANSSFLSVGRSGTGTLTIQGGVVTVGGGLTTGSFGTINLMRGGRLQIGTGGTTGVLGTNLTNHGTLVFDRSNASTYSGILSGTGSLSKHGSGTLTLASPNTLTGSTTIQQGSIRLAHAAALSASTVSPSLGGILSLEPNLQTTVGGLNPNAGGLVDVGSGHITVLGGLLPTTLVAALSAGLGDGSWNGTSGITSSVAAASGGNRTVGWLDNGDGTVTFGFAAAGDTNLDWQVDIIDAANFLSEGKFDAGTPASWNEGDFTYDGFVDILDAASFLSAGLFDSGLYNTPAGTIAAVPEPNVTAFVAGGSGLLGLAALRRKHVA